MDLTYRNADVSDAEVLIDIYNSSLVTPKDNEANIRFYTGRFGFDIVGEEDDGVVTVLLFRLNRQNA